MNTKSFLISTATTAGLVFLSGYVRNRFRGDSGETAPIILTLLSESADTAPTEPESAMHRSGEDMTTQSQYPGDEEFERMRRAVSDLTDSEGSPDAIHPDHAKLMQMREQEQMATKDFAHSLVLYWRELKDEVPLQLAATLLREFQQAELNRRLNLDVHQLRFENE